MGKQEKELQIKELIKIIQNSDNAYLKEDSMSIILNMFEPFRKSLAKKFANKGVEFDDICQCIDLKLIEAMFDYDEKKDPSAIRHITSKARYGIWNYYRKEMDYFDDDRKISSLDSPVIGYESDGSPCELDKFDLWEISGSNFDEDRVIERIIIEQELENITKHQRKILEMHYKIDMTQDEIAEKLRINQANVSRAKKRGVASLKNYINPLDEHYDKH